MKTVNRPFSWLLTALLVVLIVLPASAQGPMTQRDFSKLRRELQKQRPPRPDLPSGLVKKAPAKVEANGGETILYGSIIDSYNDDRYGTIGLYNFNAYDTNSFNMVKEGLHVYGGGTFADGLYYGQYFGEKGSQLTLPVQLNVYDPKQGFAKVRNYYATWWDNIACDLAWDATQKRLYGVFWNEPYTSINQFGYITLDDPQVNAFTTHVVDSLPERMVAVAASPAGVIYVIGVSGMLYTVDKATGKATEVGSTGVNVFPWYQTACWDEASGKIFWNACFKPYADFTVFEVDPATGQTTMAMDNTYDGSGNNDQITGLTTMKDFTVTTYAPEPVSNLTVNFAGLSGTVAFTLPTQNVKGESLSGNVEYVVYINGEQKAKAGAPAGAQVAETLTLSEAGNQQVSVVAVQSDVTSCASLWKGYVGADKPAAPANVTAQAAAKNDAGQYPITVTWTAPTYGVNGGAIDPAALTYKVTRLPEGVEVYSGSELTYTDLVAAELKTSVKYAVVAINGAETSDPAESNYVQIGEQQGVPFSDDFNDTSADRSDWTIIDANNDGSTWVLNQGNYSYKYNQANPADDYVVLPAIQLEAGNLYHFDIKARNTSPTERIAAYVGKTATVEGLDTEIIAPTEITYDDGEKELRGNFIPTESGLYYFAVKACSDADMSTLRLTNVSVTMTPGTAPDAPTASVTAGAEGALNATLSITLPTKGIDGQALSALDSCIVKRNGTVVKTFASPAVGETLTFEDNTIEKAGIYTYVVAAMANGDEGNTTKVSTYVGLDMPGPVTNLRAVEDMENPGTIILTWDPPTVGQRGGYVNPEGLTYWVSIGTQGTEYYTYDRTYRDHLDISKGQTYQAYSVYAENSAGSGRYVWKTVVAIAGPAIKAPVVESFPGPSMNSGPWLTEMTQGEIGEAYWTPVDGSVIEAGSQDNDAGVISFSSRFLGKARRIMSPKIDISKMEKPQASCWIYFNGKSDRVVTEISADYGDFVTLEEVTLNTQEKGWHRLTYDLSNWKNSQFIRFGVQGISVETVGDITAFDNFSLTDAVDYDVQIGSLTGPDKVKVGETGTLNVSLRNLGNKALAAADYSIALFKNEKQVATFDGVDLAVDAVRTISLTDVPTIDDPEMTVYKASILSEKDQNAANNISNRVSVEIILPQYPRVTQLSGEAAGGKIKLFWEEPNFSDMPAQSVTERFENYPAFAIANYGDWKAVDADGAKTIRMTLSEEFGPLEYPNAGEAMAFQVFNTTEAGIPFSSWDPHSGEQMLVAFKCASPDEGQTEINNDDWLISPELNGAAQTISFYAKAAMGVYTPEKFQVLYSTTTPTVEAMTQIGETQTVTNVKGWEEDKVALPEGAKYFAIRCVSEAKFALMIDDITYIPAGAVTEELSLMGYNVYRDGQRVNGEPLPESVWTDENVEEGNTYNYRVTAVYDKGESLYSDALSILCTGVKGLTNSKARISATEGYILVSGAEGQRVEVYSMDGRLLLARPGAERLQIKTQSGYYVVKTGDKVATILVR